MFAEGILNTSADRFIAYLRDLFRDSPQFPTETGYITWGHLRELGPDVSGLAVGRDAWAHLPTEMHQVTGLELLIIPLAAERIKVKIRFPDYAGQEYPAQVLEAITRDYGMPRLDKTPEQEPSGPADSVDSPEEALRGEIATGFEKRVVAERA